MPGCESDRPDPPTLVLSPRHTDDSIRLWRAARDRDQRVERLQSWNVPARLHGRRVAIYGEPFFVQRIADQLDHVLLEPSFDWLANLPRRYLHRHVGRTNLASLDIIEFPAFVKPADDKCFEARVYNDIDDIPIEEERPERIPVLYANPVEWDLEIRAFVIDGSVETTSLYSIEGEFTTDVGDEERLRRALKEAQTFLEQFVADDAVSLPPSVVIDVGRLSSGKWAVVESNPVWSSGIYDCDPTVALDAVEWACVPGDEAREELERWSVERPNVE